MTKLDLAARCIKQFFPKGTRDSKTSLREVMYCVGNVRDEMIKSNAWAMYSAGEEIVWDGMLSPFKGVSLTKESDCLFSLELPSKPLYLPKNMGIFSVTSSHDRTKAIVPVAPTFIIMYQGSQALSLDGQLGYYQEGNKLFLLGGAITEDSTVDLLLVAQSEDIGSDEYFPFPADMENELLMRAAQQYAPTVTIPEDAADNKRDEPQ